MNPRTFVAPGHCVAHLVAAFALTLMLTACQSGGGEGSTQPDPDVATFGTALFDDAQFE